MECFLRVGIEFLPQVKKFKYLGVLFASEGKMELEVGRRIRAAGAVLHSLYCTIVMKIELSRKAKVSIYQSIFVPTLTYGHKSWVMIERTRLYKRPKWVFSGVVFHGIPVLVTYRGTGFLGTVQYWH